MASFTALVPLNLHWYGNALVGAAGTTHRIPDAHYDEFHVEVEPNIPGGVTWRSLVDDSNPAVVTLSSLTATAARFKGSPWFDVKSYGAVGDGVTDDTAAINLAITALDAVGRGTLFFPAGRYKSSGGHILVSPTQILGEGPSVPGDYDQYLSQVRCSSATAVLFKFSLVGGRVANISLDNSTTATAGAGVQVANVAAYFLQSVDFESVRITRFYIGADIQVGTMWSIRGCAFMNNVLYGVKVQNTITADSGDWTISDSVFYAVNSSSGLRIQSSGGGRIIGNKFLSMDLGIDIAVSSAVATGNLFIVGNSIEVATTAIKGTTAASSSTWRHIVITGNELSVNAAAGHAVHLVATTASDFSRISITDNVLNNTALAGSAFALTKCDNAYIGSHTLGGFGSLLAATTCTNLSGVGGQAGSIGAITAAVVIANTETAIISGSIAAGFLRAGTTFRFLAYGRLTSGATGGSSLISIRAGSAVPYLATLTIVNANNKTNAPFKLEGLLTIRSVGVSGTGIAEISAIGGVGTAPFTTTNEVTAVSATSVIDTTADCPVYFQYQSGNAGTTATFEVATIEVVNAA